MANITNTLIANITATEDSTQNVIVNRTVPNLAFDSTTGLGVIYALHTGGVLSMGDLTRAYQLYLRNNDTVNNITPTITFFGGAVATSIMYPGDVLILWQKPGGVNAGFTAISVAVSANCLIEYFIGG